MSSTTSPFPRSWASAETAGTQASAGTATIASWIDGQSDAVVDPAGSATSQDRMRRACAIGPDSPFGSIGDSRCGAAVLAAAARLVQHDEVISGGVAAGVARPQDPGQGLTTGDVQAVQEDQQWVEPEAVLIGRGGALLLAVGGHQAGIDVQREPFTAGQVRTCPGRPCTLPGHPRLPKRTESGSADPVQDAVRRRVRGDRTEQRGLVTQRGQVRQAVPTISQGDSQISQDPTRQVHRSALEGPQQSLRQPAARPDSSASSRSNAAPACDTIPAPSAVTSAWA